MTLSLRRYTTNAKAVAPKGAQQYAGRMQQTPPQLFDYPSVTAHRMRSKKLDPKFQFLRTEVADRMRERLEEINRDFPKRLDLASGFARFVPGLGDTFDTLPISDTKDGALPGLPDAPTYDLITANLEFHWINDLPGLLVQLRRCLNPDGMILASLFGGETLHELRHALIAAEVEITGGASPRVIPFADVKDVGSLLQRAGFALPVTDMDTLRFTYEHPLQLMHELRGMGETNALKDRPKHFLRRDVMMRACELYAEKHQLENGRIPATFDVVYLTGWQPHESQQKPLKPGSGKVSLADALKAGQPKQNT